MPEKERKGVGNYSSEVRKPLVIFYAYFCYSSHKAFHLKCINL